MKQSSGFSGRLRELRDKAGLTQAALADKAGIHLHSLIKLERGEREPQWASVRALAKALGVTCQAFDVDDDQAEPDAKPVARRGERNPNNQAKGKRKKGQAG